MNTCALLHLYVCSNGEREVLLGMADDELSELINHAAIYVVKSLHFNDEVLQRSVAVSGFSGDRAFAALTQKGEFAAIPAFFPKLLYTLVYSLVGESSTIPTPNKLSNLNMPQPMLLSRELINKVDLRLVARALEEYTVWAMSTSCWETGKEITEEAVAPNREACEWDHYVPLLKARYL